MEDVLSEAKWLAQNGVTEIIVIAQDTTRYGEDLYGTSKLPELLEKLCEIDGLKWIRVLYCYPERITDELLEVMASQEKIVKYMDIPIQHCNGEILRNMNRSGDESFLRKLLEKIRNKVPGIVLRTTLITGFPGETDKQFEELAEFVKDMKFDKLGCFPYSQEEGTVAADFDGQLDEEVKNHRAEIIMEQQQLISEQKNAEKMNGVFEVVVEGFDKWAECHFGRTAGDAPDIDGKIFFTGNEKMEIGQYVTVKVTDTLDYDLIGEVISNEPA
jgi:ribosomal protein S12 methylthiotransferase